MQKTESSNQTLENTVMPGLRESSNAFKLSTSCQHYQNNGLDPTSLKRFLKHRLKNPLNTSKQAISKN